MAALNTAMVTVAIDAILAKLEPLRRAGIICRAVANTPGATGNLLLNGQIVVVWGGDSAFSPLEGMNSQQAYTSTFALLGRMTNLKSASGLEAVRDVLYAQLGGLWLPGYAGAISISSFTVGARQNDNQPFEMTITAPGLLTFCNEYDDGSDEVANAAMGVLLAELNYTTEVVQQPIEFGS